MKRKYIVNPSAGRERTLALLQELQETEHVLTKDFADIEAQTRLALKDGFEQIVAVGGDGTLNAAVNAYFEPNSDKPINPEACLALAPFGTGSDYSKTVNPEQKEWREILDKPEIRSVDVGHVEFLRTHRRRLFLNMATTGLAAEVVRRREQASPLVPSAVAYALPTVTSLFKYKASPVSVKIDDAFHEMQLLAGFFAKGIFAGGGMKLGGSTALDDGLLDILLVKGMPLHQCLQRLPKLYSGNFEGDPHFLKVQARSIEIHSQHALLLECDGDVAGSTDFKITVWKKAVPFCFPRPPKKPSAKTKTK